MNKDTTKNMVHQEQQVPQEHTPNKSTKKWVEENFGNDKHENSSNQIVKDIEGESTGKEVSNSPVTIIASHGKDGPQIKIEGQQEDVQQTPIEEDNLSTVRKQSCQELGQEDIVQDTTSKG